MFNGSNCDRKSHLSKILTEPLNPRVACLLYLKGTEDVTSNDSNLNIYKPYSQRDPLALHQINNIENLHYVIYLVSSDSVHPVFSC